MPEGKERVAAQIDRALREWGLFFLKDHGVPKGLTDQVWAFTEASCWWTDAVALLVKFPVPSGGDRPRRSLSH